MSNWKDVRNKLNITPEEENVIELEKDLIRTMERIREEQGLSQADLADKCNVKQPVIARMERIIPVDSAAGALHQYKNVSKISREKDVFANEMVKKHS